MEVLPEEYTRYYIVQALFKLMSSYEYNKISVTEIAEKAGVGRATFYRYFKRKEDIIVYYFDHYKKEFIFSQHLYPRCKDDYVKVVTSVLTLFKQNKEPIRLLRKARLEYLYLDYLNKNFAKMFAEDYPDSSEYAPTLYSGMLFNVSMKWLDEDWQGRYKQTCQIDYRRNLLIKFLIYTNQAYFNEKCALLFAR